MFSNKLKSLLVFALVLLLACSFAVLAHAEDNSNVSSAEPFVSEAQSDAQSEAESAASDVSGVLSEEVSSEESVAAGDESEAEAASNTPSWLGWAIAGGVILAVALWLFVAIRRNTPFGQKIVKFFKDYKSEIKKVVWLSKQELIKKTGVVLVTIVIASIVLGLLDYAFTKLISLIK